MKLINSALLLVDVQNDFLPGGSLAVTAGDQLIPVINALQEKFDFIVATQDFHPSDHGSFAANHVGRKEGELIDLNGLSQVLWPIHCVQQSEGTAFPKELNTTKWKAIFQKGKNPEVDSYSGFYDNARRGDTGLGDFLNKEGITKVFIAGLAQDYCVKFTALDSVSLGFETSLIVDATKPVNLSPEDGDYALQEMKSAGVKLLTSQEILR